MLFQHQSLPTDFYHQILEEDEMSLIQGKSKDLIGEYQKPVWQVC